MSHGKSWTAGCLSLLALLASACDANNARPRVTLSVSREALLGASHVIIEGQCTDGTRFSSLDVPLDEAENEVELVTPACGEATLSLLAVRKLSDGADRSTMVAAYYGEASAVLAPGDIRVTFPVSRVGEVLLTLAPSFIDQCTYDVTDTTGLFVTSIDVGPGVPSLLLLSPGTYTGACRDVAGTSRVFDVVFAERTALEVSRGTNAAPALVVEAPSTINEGQKSALRVSLSREPTSDVIVALGARSTEVSLSPTSVRFDANNWDIPVTIDLAVADDRISTGARRFVIDLIASSTDASFAGVDATISGDVLDDDKPGLLLTPIGPARTSEASDANHTTTFALSLLSAPLADVTVSLTPSSSEATTSPGALTFTAADFATPKIVTVTGVDDGVDDGDVIYSITATASSADATYDKLTEKLENIQSWDDDVAPVNIAASTPLSPSSSLMPMLSGFAEPFAAVEIFADACMAPALTTVFADASGAFSAAVAVPANTTTTLFALATSQHGYVAPGCGGGFTYTQDGIPPGMLTVVNRTPTSPSNLTTTPTVSGTGAEAGATVRLYTSSMCMEPHSGEVGVSAGGSWSVTALSQAANTSATYFARQLDAAQNPGPCSLSSVSFTHDNQPPAQPTVSMVSPLGPSTVQMPVVTVVAELGSLVSVYFDPTCSGPIEGSAPASAGTASVPVSVLNATRTFYATATDAATNTSLCSPMGPTYTNDIIPPAIPGAPTLTPLDGAISVSFGAATDNLTSVTYEIDSVAAPGILDGTPEVSGLAVTSHLLTGLNNCQTYQVAVRARDQAGNADVYSTPSSIDLRPAAPTIIGVRLGPGEAELAWTPVPGAIGYEVCAAAGSVLGDCVGVPGSQIFSVPTTSVRLSGLPLGIDAFRVRAAWNGACLGATSAEATPGYPYSYTLSLAGGLNPATPQGSDQTGHVTTVIPDLNGDGIDDLAVGAPNAGRVFILDGQFRRTLRVFSDAPADQFGAAIAVIDDVTGDGYPELAVGAPGAAVNNGRIALLDIVRTRTVWSYQPATGQRFGASIAAIPDIGPVGPSGSDGRRDIAAGGASPSGTGYVEVITSLNHAFVSSRTGNPGFELGAQIACCVDTRPTPFGDGIGELIVGAPGALANDGRVLVADPANLASAVAINGPVGAAGRFGAAISIIGDVDGDNRTDFVVGAHAHDVLPSDDRGRIAIYSGATDPPSLIDALTGPSGVVGFGGTLGQYGDIDADGFADFLVGAPLTGGTDGRVWLLSGRTHRPLYDRPGNSAEWLGSSLAAADLDRNGVAEIIAGAPFAVGSSGAIYAFTAGKTPRASPAAPFVVSSLEGYEWGEAPTAIAPLLYPLAAEGPTGVTGVQIIMNGSSASIGPPANYTPGNFAAYDILRYTDAELRQWDVRYFVATNPPPVRTIPGTTGGLQLGSVIADVGDVDGDGVTDLALGTPLADPGATDAGEVHLFSGATNLPLSPGVLVGTPAASARFGAAIASLGDINGDGRAEIVIGAPGAAAGAGAVYIFDLAAGPSPIATVFGGGGDFGASLAVLGDPDFDGDVDIAVGAPFDNGLGTGRGRVEIEELAGAFGASGPFTLLGSTGPGGIATGTTDNENFGSSIAIGGFDPVSGALELAIGSPGAGKITVVDAPTLTPQLVSSSVPALQRGKAIVAIGDITNDGHTDFAVGAPGAAPGGMIELIDGSSFGPSGPTGPPLRTITGPGPERLGQALAFFGLVDREPLVLAGGVGPTGGRVQVVAVNTNVSINPSPVRFERIVGAPVDFGRALAVLGDQVGDGRITFVVGSPLSDLSQMDGGQIDHFDFGLRSKAAHRPAKLALSGPPGPNALPLQWVDTNSNPNNEMGYQVEYREPLGIWQPGPTLPPDTTNVSLMGLSPNRQYTVRVRAIGTSSAHSPWSIELDAATSP